MNLKEMKYLVILAGPSGVGKSHNGDLLMKRHPDRFVFSVSDTTRPLRPHEVEGKNYCRITTEQFLANAEQGLYIESEEVYPGIWYGTRRDKLEAIWDFGRTPLLDIDLYGANKLRGIFGELAIAIAMIPPSIETLEDWLRKRKTETEEAIKRRIAKAPQEIEAAKLWPHVIVSERSQKPIQEILEIITPVLKLPF